MVTTSGVGQEVVPGVTNVLASYDAGQRDMTGTQRLSIVTPFGSVTTLDESGASFTIANQAAAGITQPDPPPGQGAGS